MKKPQFITIVVGIVALVLLFIFGNTVSRQKHGPNDGHDHSTQNNDNQTIESDISVDSLLAVSKKTLPASQSVRLDLLEKSITRGDVKEQQSHIYHQLANFWRDTGRNFIPYAWYTAEGARLENSEKSLTFAGHLFLNGLQQQENPELRRWMAIQAKDLLDRSLILNPNNDSSKVGIGAAYLFGGISPAPMEGISKIREVVAKDSTNIYAQMTLATASLMSGQNDKAMERLLTVVRLNPQNAEATLLLGDLFEKKGDKQSAILYYGSAAGLINNPDIQLEINKRIADLKK
ncbi:MAG: tetratricopeptide repeat protein [Niabella sp.]